MNCKFLKYKIKPESYDPVGSQADDRRHIRPAKMKVKTGNDEQAKKKETGQALDDLLALLSLSDRPSLDPASQ